MHNGLPNFKSTPGEELTDEEISEEVWYKQIEDRASNAIIEDLLDIDFPHEEDIEEDVLGPAVDSKNKK